MCSVIINLTKITKLYIKYKNVFIYLFMSAFIHNDVQQRDKNSDSTPAAPADYTSLSKFSAIMQSSVRYTATAIMSLCTTEKINQRLAAAETHITADFQLSPWADRHTFIIQAQTANGKVVATVKYVQKTAHSIFTRYSQKSAIKTTANKKHTVIHCIDTTQPSLLTSLILVWHENYIKHTCIIIK